MRKALIAVALLVCCEAMAFGSNITVFDGGMNEEEADLHAPDCFDVVNLSIPAECHILFATAKVSGSAVGGAYPENVSVSLNGTTLWEFNAIGYGPLGMQDEFYDGKGEWSSCFGSGGGANSTWLRLPRNATIRNATVEISRSGRGNLDYFMNFSDMSNNYFGESVSDAGDVNNDGYDDVVIGAWQDMTGGYQAGRAFIYYGGPGMNSTPDVTLTGAAGDEFGVSVSSAGDVNNDTYGDVIIGAFANSANGQYAGRAYIYFGGPNMDSDPDVVLTGEAPYDAFGCSVSGAGDVNRDGFDDVIVGARGNDAGGENAGRAYIYYGGRPMDDTADVVLTGADAGDWFGVSVSGAGDVNNDAYDDVVVGAPTNGSNGNSGGHAYVYFGGPGMDNAADVVVAGEAGGDSFGVSVSGAGDVNRDGHDDVLVGASGNDAGGNNAGRAYIYYGGTNMDDATDVTFTGAAADDRFGMSVSGAGDVNKDGYDDVAASAYMNDAGGAYAGRVYVYYGGAAMDATEDESLTGAAAGDGFGWKVSGAGDVDKDGYDDVIMSSVQTGPLGRAYIFASQAGMKGAAISIGQTSLWSDQCYFNGTNLSSDFGPMLNQLLHDSTKLGSDKYGNGYADLQIQMSARSGGTIKLRNLRIVYSFNAAIPDFSDKLDRYISAHRSEKDASGNITVPLTVRSRTAGNVRLANLNVSIDEPPRLFKPVPDRAMDEDSVAPGLIDLWDCFRDDLDAGSKLKFGVELTANGSIVKAEVADNRYVSVDAYEGPQNDNWTGTVGMRLSATDRWNQMAWSNPFNISIRDVPDPPVFTSEPPSTAVAGQDYIYNITAADGDNDALRFGLGRCPLNMTVNSSSGRLAWMPRVAAGRYAVSITVTDGMFTTFQDYSILVPNSPPEVRNTSVPDAVVGLPFSYLVPGIDDNGDILSYSIAQPLEGMAIDSRTGKLIWTPLRAGSFRMAVLVSDGIETIVYEFNISVKEGNHAPKFTSRPVLTAYVDGLFTYIIKATDADNDTLTYVLASGPPGMYLANSTGVLGWTPASVGNFTVRLEVLDGKGGIGEQNFTIGVMAAIRPAVNIVSPASRDWKGVVTITGTVVKGTRQVSRVQICVDSGDWMDAVGTYYWSYPLDTTSLADGKHRISVRAFDGKEYSDILPAAVTISNRGGTEGSTWILLLASVLIVAAGVGGYTFYRKMASGRPAKTGDEQEEAARMTVTGQVAGGMAYGETTPPAEGIPAKTPSVPEAFAIDDLFLMYKDGRLILHNTRRIKADMDMVIVAGMLTALQGFVKESMGREKGAELGSMEYGGSKILLENGKHIVIAAVIVGGEPAGFRDEMRSAVVDIESEFETVLPTWDGSPRELADAKRFLTRIGTFRPALEAPAETGEGAVSVRSELEFYQGFVRLKVAVKNDMPAIISRATFTLEHDERSLRLDSVEPAYERKGQHVELGILYPGEKKALAFYLDPQICTETQIEGILTYKDAGGNLETVKMPRKLASVVCPILYTEENINTAMLKRMMADELDKKDTKVFSVPAQFPPEKAFELAKAAVQHHDLKLVREFSKAGPFVGEAWYFGKAKGREGKLVIRTRVLGEKGILEFFVASDSTLMLTGMLAELKSDLNKELAAQKGIPEMRQVTAPEEVEAVARTGTAIETAADAEDGPTGTEGR